MGLHGLSPGRPNDTRSFAKPNRPLILLLPGNLHDLLLLLDNQLCRQHAVLM